MGRENTPLVTVHKIEELSKTEVIEFAKNASLFTEDPAHENMWKPSWEDRPETFPYLVYLSPRFIEDNGQMYAVKIDGIIEAVGGVHISSFDKNVALAGVRTWVNPEHRGKFLIGQYIMPLQRQWAKEKGCKLFFLTFNDYNKNLIKVLKRGGMGRKKIGTFSGLFENGMHEAPFPCNIQYTKQWVVYESFDTSYIFNWDSIKWHK